MLAKTLTPKAGGSFGLNRITVLIGPHNSGKSETLRDLYRLVTNSEPSGSSPQGDGEVRTSLIDDFQYDLGLSFESALHGLQTAITDGSDELLAQGIGPNLQSGFSYAGSIERVKGVLRRRPLTAKAVWRSGIQPLLYLRAAYLSPDTRLELVRNAPACSPAAAPESLLQTLQLAVATKHEELADAFRLAFPDQHLFLDDTERVQLTLRLAGQAPNRSDDPAEAVRQFRKLRRLEDEGIGYQAFASLILSLLLTEGRLVLLDQPEAYLHPDHTRQLGGWVGRLFRTLGSQLVVATHDMSFVAGLLAASNEVDLYRVVRRRDSTRYQPIPADPARKLAHSPLLFGQRGLDCLLRDGVVVTESKEEQAFYQTIAVREFGADHVGFVHGYGRQTLPYITKLVNSIGVPTVVIAGLDLLQGKTEFTGVVEAMTGAVPQTTWIGTRDKLATFAESRFDRRTLTASRHEVEAFLAKFAPQQADEPGGPLDEPPTRAAPEESDVISDTGPEDVSDLAVNRWDAIHADGLSAISNELRPWVEQLFEELKGVGIFLTPKGELRRWVDATPAPAENNNWFIKALTDFQSRRCPAELRAFVADVTNYLKTRQVLESRRGS